MKSMCEEEGGGGGACPSTRVCMNLHARHPSMCRQTPLCLEATCCFHAENKELATYQCHGGLIELKGLGPIEDTYQYIFEPVSPVATEEIERRPEVGITDLGLHSRACLMPESCLLWCVAGEGKCNQIETVC